MVYTSAGWLAQGCWEEGAAAQGNPGGGGCRLPGSDWMHIFETETETEPGEE